MSTVFSGPEKTVDIEQALLSNHAHILLRIGKSGLPTFIRRFLCGCAISYNRRHSRVLQKSKKVQKCHSERAERLKNLCRNSLKIDFLLYSK